MATAAPMPAAASRASIWDERSAFRIDGSPSLDFGVRRKAVWNWINPRRQARLTTQLSANQTCMPAMASRQVHRVLTFIAHTARISPEARNASGRASATPVSWRMGNW